jgi:hypothetical protein
VIRRPGEGAPLAKVDQSLEPADQICRIDHRAPEMMAARLICACTRTVPRAETIAAAERRQRKWKKKRDSPPGESLFPPSSDWPPGKSAVELAVSGLSSRRLLDRLNNEQGATCRAM